MAPIISFVALSAVVLNGAIAHPGHSVAEEVAERTNWFQTRQPKSVRNCENSLRRRGHLDTAVARRQQLANEIRAKRGIVRRSLAEYNISHASNKDVTLGDDETILFADDSSCVLQPEVTQGPYYIDGELFRYDITEDQAGVPVYFDLQVLDTNTCEPVTAVYVDAWHCNSTGVYSGVVVDGNGDGSADPTNLDATFLRGIQQTDANGVVQFKTIFPGHYTGRTNHLHILSHNVADTTVRSNGTLFAPGFNTSATHVGQVFFDDALIAAVEAVSPYKENTLVRTQNVDDQFLIAEAATEGSDPFAEYILINPDDISEGILMWISVGIDSSADYETTSAGTLQADGGVKNDDFALGPGGAPPGVSATGSAAATASA